MSTTENTDLSEVSFAYSPSALLNIFSNTINVSQTKKMVTIKGVYLVGKGTNYNGYYYDFLRDESSDASMTLIVPGLIRNKLTHNKTLTFWGYITKRVVNSGGRIEIQINMTELVEQSHNKYSDEEIEALELLQKKASLGYKDVESIIKKKVAANETVRITIIVGKTAIIDQDINHQLSDALTAFSIDFIRVPLTSEEEIARTLSITVALDCPDVIAVARGGGENLGVFNKLSLAKVCLELPIPFCTAIGHKDDITLVQQIADKAFITPTAFGQFLNDVYNDTIEELQNSRAKLVEDITKTLDANYKKQIQNLNDQLRLVNEQNQKRVSEIQAIHLKEKESLERLKAQEKKSMDELLTSYKKQVESLRNQPVRPAPAESSNSLVVIVVIIIVILIIIALASSHH